MNVPALVVGAISGLLTVRGLVSGDRWGVRRADKPLIYWAVIATTAAVSTFLIYIGATSRS